MIYKSNWQKAVERNQKWHNWFAWYPISVWVQNEWKKVWMQTVERKWTLIPGMLGHATTYRIKNDHYTHTD